MFSRIKCISAALWGTEYVRRVRLCEEMSSETVTCNCQMRRVNSLCHCLQPSRLAICSLVLLILFSNSFRKVLQNSKPYFPEQHKLGILSHSKGPGAGRSSQNPIAQSSQVRRKGFPSKVPKQGSQARFSSKVPKPSSQARFPSKFPGKARKRSKEEVPRKRFPRICKGP